MKIIDEIRKIQKILISNDILIYLTIFEFATFGRHFDFSKKNFYFPLHIFSSFKLFYTFILSFYNFYNIIKYINFEFFNQINHNFSFL